MTCDLVANEIAHGRRKGGYGRKGEVLNGSKRAEWQSVDRWKDLKRRASQRSKGEMVCP